MASLKEHELRPYHVIVTSSYEHLIAECLMDVHDFRRPRLKQPMSIGRKLLTIDAESEMIEENAFAEVGAQIGLHNAEVDAQVGLWRALSLITAAAVAVCRRLLHAILRVV